MSTFNKPHPRTVGGRIAHWAMQQPDRDAYIFRSARIGRLALSRHQVNDMSSAFALRLGSVGVVKGDIVCNTLQNSPERVVSDLGILALGAVLLDKRVFRRDLSDMVNLLNQSEARLVIVDPEEQSEEGFPSAWEAIRSKCSAIGDVDMVTSSVTVTWPDVISLQHIMFCSRGVTGTEFDFLKSLETLGQSREPGKDSSLYKVEPQDLAVLFPTSGSTGLPKLSIFTHTGILDMADDFFFAFPLRDEIILQDRPIGWQAGFHHAYLCSGTPRVMTDARTEVPESSVELIWTYIVEEGVTFAHLTPQTVSKLMSHQDLIIKHGFRLRELMMTGQPLRKNMAHVIGVLADSMCNSYGSTEIGYVTVGRCKKESDFDDFLVGYALTNSEILVVDENLQPVESGVTGEVLVRVQGHFQGYYRNEVKTKAALLPGGWFRTDDIGKMDAQGRLFVYGRQSDAIMRGVVIVYPYNMEKRLATISGLENIMVVAVPDPELYHEICACVVLTAGSDLTAESLKQSFSDVCGKWQDDFPVPKFIIVFDGGFPTTATGKVSRKLVQAEACKRLGLQA